MNRFVKRAISFLCAAAVAFSFAACGQSGSSGSAASGVPASSSASDSGSAAAVDTTEKSDET